MRVSDKNIELFKVDRRILVQSLCMAFGMFIFFLATFVIEGINLTNISLPSASNDELVYFYEVSGILDYGFPMGYFGYTEVTARALSFGAWSPVLLINYCIFGFLFGWTPVKAVFYNEIFLMMAVFLFGILAKPNRKQSVMIVIFFASYTYIMYGVFSINPEITCYSYAIVFLGLIYSCLNENKNYKVGLMFVIAVLLTLMRPYYAGLIIVSAYFLYKLKGRHSLIISFAITLVSMYSYFFIGINFCAGLPIGGYFSKWISKLEWNYGNNFLSSSITIVLLNRVGDTLNRLFNGLKSVASLWELFFVHRVYGRNFVLFVVVFFVIAYVLYKRRKTDNDKKLLLFYWIIYMLGMLMAVSLYFPGYAADRHFAEFVVMGLVILAMELSDDTVLPVLVELILLFALIMVPNPKRDYVDVDYMNDIIETRVLLQSEAPIISSKTPQWDNTMLWVYKDTVEGEPVEIPWRALFAFPSGYGFNLAYTGEWVCEQEYVRSKYVITVPGGSVEAKCAEWGGSKIAEYCGAVVYRLY